MSKLLRKKDLLSESIYVQIRSKIISGEWPIGMRLNEKQIADDLFVSRTPVRRALNAICEEGLLDYSKNWGYYVKIVTKRDIEEIFRIRIALETLATCEAAKNMTDADLRELEEINTAAMQVAQNDVNDYQELFKLSTSFNDKINRLCAMPKLRLLQEGLQDYLHSFRTLSFKKNTERRVLAISEHQGIVEAMKARDELLIAERVQAHLSHACEYIKRLVPSDSQSIKL